MMALTPNELLLYSVLLIGFASVLLDIYALVYNKREFFYYQLFFLFVAAGVVNNHYTMIIANTKQSFLNDEAIICTQPTLRVVKQSEGFVLKGEYLINKEQILDLKDCKTLESKGEKK